MILITTTFTDIFKKSFLKDFGTETSGPLNLMLTLTVAMILGFGIYCIYKRCYTGVVYDHSFNVSLVVMAMLVAIIIVTISSNITLSLGMVGALSIVRYRTAVKNPLDLMFMFWSITTGIAVGANYFMIALIGFFFVAVIFLILNNSRGNMLTYMMVIHFEGKPETEENIRRALHPYRYKLRSKIMKKDVAELSVELTVKRDNSNLTNTVMEIEGVIDATLVQYRGSYND